MFRPDREYCTDHWLVVPTREFQLAFNQGRQVSISVAKWTLARPVVERRFSQRFGFDAQWFAWLPPNVRLSRGLTRSFCCFGQRPFDAA
jgi:hypothetical protein